MSKITYEDKVGIEPKTVAINQCQDVDMNMTKNVVNDNDTCSVSLAYPIRADKTSAGRRFGSFSEPLSGTIILSTSDAQEGGCGVIVWLGDTIPDFSGGTIISFVGEVKEVGTYSIYYHYLEGGFNINIFAKGEYIPPLGRPAQMEITDVVFEGIENSVYLTKYDMDGDLINNLDAPALDGQSVKTIIAEGSAPVNFTAPATDYPTFFTGILNGHAVLDFVSGDKLDSIQAMGMGDNCTIMSVAMSKTAMVSGNQTFFGSRDGITNRLQINIDTRNVDGRVLGLANDDTGTILLTADNNSRLAANEWKVQCVTYEENTALTGYENGIFFHQEIMDNTTINYETDFSMGRLTSGIYIGQVAIVYCWARILTAQEITEFSQELMTKYAIT